MTEEEKIAAESCFAQIPAVPAAASSLKPATAAPATPPAPAPVPAPVRPAQSGSRQDVRCNAMIAVMALLNDLSADDLAGVRSAALAIMQSRGKSG